MDVLKPLIAKDLEIESRLLSLPKLEDVKSVLQKVNFCNVSTVSCVWAKKIWVTKQEIESTLCIEDHGWMMP